ncbi:membrane spanning protein [Bacillus freudenreichii]|nr:membrane spanning protein [Bacillus freudenreichii]
MYWFSILSHEPYKLHNFLKTFSYSKKLVLTALLSAIAAILQSTGNLLPGVGYLISPFATLPILVCCIISISNGLQSYFLTLLLLILIQPAEFFVFPFTTGLIGLGIGIALLILKRRISIIVFTSLLLLSGICFLLYIVQFPVLGPTAGTSLSLKVIGFIYIFSFIYSWIWVELSRFILKKWYKLILKIG